MVLNQKGSLENDKEKNQSASSENATASNLNQFSFNLTNDLSIDYANLYAQQMQQYQQMYVNYMTQYLNNNNLDLNQSSANASINSNLIHSMNALSIMNSMLFNQVNPLLMPNLASPTNSPIILSDNPRTNTQQVNNETIERLNENQDANEEDIDLQNNWLDVFWNLLILFSLASSSISRTLFIIAISLVYYLYKSGFFSFIRTRFFHNLLRNMQNENNRNNIPNEEQLQHMMDNLQMPGLRSRRVENQAASNSSNSNENTARNRETNDNQTSYIWDKFRFLYMIISSLILSLMPNNGQINVPAN